MAATLGLLCPAWATDLAPIAFLAPSEVTGTLRPTVTLVWGVTNNGPGTAVGWWSDTVYFSPDGIDWQEIAGRGEVGPVAAGESYWRTNTVQVPVFESGTNYLMFRTDAEDFLHESDTNNNSSAVTLVNFTILAPDLAPVALQVPSPITGSPHPLITVIWAVTNQGVGSVAAPGRWTDRIVSSVDPVLDDDDYPAGFFQRDGPLAAGDSYWVTNTIRVAAAQSGIYYVILETDWGNQLHESDPNNNVLVAPVEITVFPPDLTAVAFQVPERVTGPPNPLVTLVWNVMNQGPGPAPSWGDRVHLSAEPVVNPAKDIVVSWSVEGGPLAPGDSYWRTNTVRVPVTESGLYYLILETDADDVLGDLNRDNDFLAVPVEFEISPPDLMPIDLQAPEVITAIPNSTVSVMWGVTNLGPGVAIAAKNWTDRLYLSSNDFVDASAVLLATGSEPGPVPAGGGYRRRNTIRLPAIEPGTYCLIFAVNADFALYESDTNNNQMVTWVTAVAPEASDLTPLVLSVPTQITGPPRTTVTLVWGVTNQSTAPAIPRQPWSNNVYFSRTPIRDPWNDVLLCRMQQADPLMPGGTLWYTNTARLPADTPSGTYYFLFHADAVDSITEFDEENNVTAVEVSWEAQPLDLAPMALEAPSPITGPPNPAVTLVWGVSNRGAGAATDWADALYLSTDAVWDARDPEITRRIEPGPLGSGETYWRTNTVRLPLLESGTYYLILKTDVGESLFESDEDNNMWVVPVTFEARRPDLSPIELQVPSLVTGPPNPSVTVIWGVTNRGVGPAVLWSDGLYLSTNGVWDSADVEITRGTEPGPVEAGQAYWRTNLVRLPVVRSGAWYLILKADAEALLHEIDEANNTLAAPIRFEVLPPDLAPLVLQAPTVVTWPPEPTVTLIWGVTNQGVGPAVGNPTWRNRVYLSHHPLLDEDDDDVVDEFETSLVEASAGVWHTNTVWLSVHPGRPFNLFFKADADCLVNESSETNNVTMVSLTVVEVFPARISLAEGERPAFLPDGSLVLCIYGLQGASYRLEASSNLTDWVRIVDFVCANLPTEVIDPQAKDFHRRFYRIQSLTGGLPGP